MNKLKALFYATPVLLMVSQAHAAVDTAAITDALTDIATVGTACFGVHLAIKCYKWIRQAT